MATWKRILLEGSDLTTGDIAGQAITGTTGSFSSTVSWSGGSSGNANTAYTYSQVGHLPLAGGQLSGGLGIGVSPDSTNNQLHVKAITSGHDAGITLDRGGSKAHITMNNGTTEGFTIANKLQDAPIRFRVNDGGTEGNALVISGADKSATFSGAVSGTTGTFTGTLSAEQLTSTDDLTVAGLATVGETLVVTGNTTTTGDFLVSSGDPTITIKRSNNTAYAGHIDFTNSADTLGWQLGTNILVGDGTGFEINYLGSNKLSISTGGNTTVSGNLVVSGDLTISGSTTTVNTATITVEDPLIKLASGNSSADTVDIGFYGLCDPSGSQDTYTGLIRDASDGEYHLFDLLQTEPTTTMDTSGTGFDHADLTVGALTADDNSTFGGVVTIGNLKVTGASNSGQGSDGQVLTSTGSGVTWGAAGGGLWQRSSTTLSPGTAGDSISVAAGTFSGDVTISNADPVLYLTNSATHTNNRNWSIQNGAGGDGYGDLAFHKSSSDGGSITTDQVFKLDKDSNATFAGDVGVGGSPESTPQLDVVTAGASPTSILQIRGNRDSYGNIRTRIETVVGGSQTTDFTYIGNDSSSTATRGISLRGDGNVYFSGQGTFYDNLNLIKSGSATLTIKGNASGANASLTLMEQTTTMWEIRADGGSSDKLMFLDTGGAEVLALAQDSNATFGGAITAGGLIRTSYSGAAGIEVDSSNGNDAYIDLAAGSANWTMRNTGNCIWQYEGTEMFKMDTAGYFTIDHSAQNGIKIYGNDTACLYIYDKADGSLSGGLTFGHADAEFLVYTNGVSSNSEALKIASDNTATFAGTILGIGGDASTPSIAFSSDTNTGIFKEGADSLGITVGGNKTLQVSDSSVFVFGKEGSNASLALYADEGDDDNDKYRIYAVDGGGGIKIQTVISSAWKSHLEVAGDGKVYYNNQNSESFMWRYQEDSNYVLQLGQIVTSGLVKHSFNVRNAGTWYDNNLVLDRGMVGVGIAPTMKLESYASDSSAYSASQGWGSVTGAGIGIHNANNTTNATSNLVFYVGGTGSNQSRIAHIKTAASSSALAFITQHASSGRTEKLRITDAGDVKLLTDGASLAFGADSETTLQHQHNAGLILNAAMGLFFRDYGGEYIYSAADGDLRIQSGTSLSTNAKFGIGHSSPVTALDVHSAGTEVAAVFGMADDDTVWVSTRVAETVDKYSAYAFMVGSAAVDGVGSTNTTAFISSAVTQAGTLKGNLKFNINSGDNLHNCLELTDAGTAILNTNQGSSIMWFKHQGTANGAVYGTGTSFGLLDQGGNWAYKHNNDSSHQWMTHDTERMILYSNGYLDATRFRSRENTNYYIDPNDTSALYALEIYSNLGMNSTAITATKQITFSGSGTAADYSLYKASNDYLYLMGGTAGLILKGKNSDDSFTIYNNSEQRIYHYTNNTERMVIHNDGTTIQTALAVNGGTNLTVTSSSNAITTALKLIKTNSSGAGNDDAGAAIDFYAENKDGGTNQITSRIAGYTSDATGGVGFEGGLRFYTVTDGYTPSEALHIDHNKNATFAKNITLSDGHDQELSTGDNSLVIKNSQSTTAGGLEIKSSQGNHCLQLYGESSTDDYGFLDGGWTHWDIRKTRNGRMYMNNNNTYYIQTDGASYFGSTITVNSQGNSSLWYTGYNERRQWDGGSTNLNADTAKNSLALNTGNGVRFARVACNTADDANYNLKVSGNIYASGSNAYFQYSNFYGAYLGGNWRKTLVSGDHSDIATSNGQICTDGWFRNYGDGGIYFNSHGGGWHMTDATWIRAYNNKSVYVAANLEIGGTARFDGIVYFHGTNRGRATSYGSYATELHQIHGISFSSGSGDWDAYMNHGIASSDENGNDNDCVSINSYNQITCRLDTNNNNNESYFRITNNNTGSSNVIARFGYDGTRAVHQLDGKVGIATGADASYALKVNGHTYIANYLYAVGNIKFSTSHNDTHFGIMASDHNNNSAEAVSINSPNDITFHMNTDNSGTGYFRIKSNTSGSGASIFNVQTNGDGYFAGDVTADAFNTGDINMKNDKGDFTLSEEADFIKIKNNKTGKLYRLVMEEITND